MKNPKAKIHSFVEYNPRTGKEEKGEGKKNHSSYATDIDLEKCFPDAVQTFQASNFLHDFGTFGERSLGGATSRKKVSKSVDRKQRITRVWPRQNQADFESRAIAYQN
jgi:hypothetical protein